MPNTKTVSRETPADPVSRPRRDCAEHALPVPRATLGDREAREYGIEPLDATTAPAFARLGQRDRAIAAAVEAERAIVRHRISSVLDVDLGGVPHGDEVRRRIERQRARPRPTECAACGFPCCTATDALTHCPPIPSGAMLPEDHAASDMFDGDEPADEPVLDVAEELQRVTLERDEAIRALDRAIDERRALQQQLDEAIARCLQLEEENEALLEHVR